MGSIMYYIVYSVSVKNVCILLNFVGGMEASSHASISYAIGI